MLNSLWPGLELSPPRPSGTGEEGPVSDYVYIFCT
ncbi:unnamed protein product [Brassica rapa subsp. trilocularis]